MALMEGFILQSDISIVSESKVLYIKLKLVEVPLSPKDSRFCQSSCSSCDPWSAFDNSFVFVVRLELIL